MLKKNIALVLVLFLVIGGVWAQASTGKVITLQLWHHLTASDGEIFNALLDKFNATHPNIHIDYTMMPDEQLPTKVAAAIATGDPPDIGFRMMADVTRWYDDGAIVPLDDLMKTAGLNLKDFLPEYLAASTYKGKLIMLPMDVSPHAMLINVKDAKAAGLDVTKPPTDGASLLKWAMAMAKSSGNQVTHSGLLLTGSGVAPNVLFGILAQEYGAKRISDDRKTVTFNDTDAPRRAAQWVLDAFDKWHVSSRDVADRYKAFGQDVGSIFFTGPWTLNGYINTSGLEFMTAKNPIVGDHFTTLVDLAGLCAFRQKDANRTKAAAEAIKWLSDNSLFWVTKGRGVPLRQSVLKNPEYKNSGIPWKYREAFSNSIQGGFLDEMPFPIGAEFSYYASGDMPVAKAMDPVWAGTRSIEDGLAALENDWQRILDRYNEK
ncbi:MAG: extracellular solute-binding protein [Spirochaetes bacterium]|nr:extracellular solute-binding protein [Spirochaetota bacterium]